MKKTILFCCIMLLSAGTFAQNRFGFDIGAGIPSFSNNDDNHQPHRTSGVVTGGVYYLRKVDRHIYIGLKAAVEQYKLVAGQVAEDGYGNIGSNCSFNGTYLHVGPVFDIGVGRRREYLHIYFFATGGFLLSGTQETENFNYSLILGGYYDNYTNTTSNINPFIAKMGFGLRQQFPLSKTWYINTSETFGFFLPMTDLSDSRWTGGVELQPGYFMLQLGIMHKVKDAGLTETSLR